MSQEKTIACPHCQKIIEQKEVTSITKDQMGEDLRPEALDCLRKYLVKCDECKKTFCSNCKSIPFHEGYTCDERKLLDEEVICRFCNEYPAIKCKELDNCHQVCWHQECKESLSEACMTTCDCGHPCCGVLNENNHIGCAKCKNLNCSICQKSCTLSPSVIMKCNHPVHKSCLISKYNSMNEKGKVVIPRCNYNCTCQEILYHECVKDIAQKWIDINNKVEENTLIRMKVEKINDVKIAREKFVFYFCDTCHQPYYCGHYECFLNDDYDTSVQHKCTRCNREFLSTICPKHGDVGMVFKCMFCCNPALYKCFADETHFCDSCHQHHEQAQKGPFQNCDGNCRFAPHIPNGQKKLTGYCVLCEEEKEKSLIKT